MTKRNINKIIIVNYTMYAGGPLVLSALCAELRKIGYDARLYFVPAFIKGKVDYRQYRKTILKYNLKILYKEILYTLLHRIVRFSTFRQQGRSSMCVPGIKIQYLPVFNRKRTIVVYPEVIYGNPLGAQNVVRWFLYHNPFANEKEAFGKDDFHIAFREVFNPSDLNPQKRIVTISYFDAQLYRQYNMGTREGKCYILYKGRNRADIPSQFDGPVFDSNMSQMELVDMLNHHKYCFIYDTQTFYATIAAVCGCIPIIVLEPGKTERDYLGEGEKHLGKAYGNTPEQIAYAINTRDELLKSLDFSDRNRENALHMVSLLKERFGEIEKDN